MTTNALVTIQDQITKSAASITAGLPAHIPAEKFIRSVKTAIALSPDVQRACRTEGGIQSLKLACSRAAADGLVIDGREAALVTFRQKVSSKGEADKWEDRLQYIPMYQGLLKKLRNSGQLASISAQIVYANDHFDYQLGDDETIVHKPAPLGTDRGKGIAVYAIARLKDGTVQREVMDINAVMRIAAQSKNPDQYDQTKGKNWTEWWRKTVIRRIVKWLPASSDKEIGDIIEHADDEFEFNQDVAPAAPSPARKTRGGAAAALKDVTPPAPQPADESQDAEVYDDFDPETGEVVEARQLDSDPI